MILVPRQLARQRLDRALVSLLTEPAFASASEGASSFPSGVAGEAGSETAITRGEVQRWIEMGRVTIDGKIGAAKDRVREGAKVEVDVPPPKTTAALPEEGIRFDVIHRDKAILVVDKPAGLVVHPAPGHPGGTLVNGLLALGAFTDPRLQEGEMLRPGIVHRLDKGTSGVMVVARTTVAREALKEQFQAHSIERSYLALAEGDVKEQRFATLHGRHPTDRMRFSSHVRSGKQAITRVEPIEHFSDSTLVRCTLETGRTHQIRMHLAEAGHAIIGDPLYGKPPKSARLRALALAIGHQVLHAAVLGFVHPTSKKNVRYESALPKDVADALASLRE